MGGHYMPLPESVACKARLPNCTRCYGCNTRLREIHFAKMKFLGVEVLERTGGSGSYVYHATTDRLPSRQAVVKFGCVPFTPCVPLLFHMHTRCYWCRLVAFLVRARLGLAGA